MQIPCEKVFFEKQALVNMQEDRFWFCLGSELSTKKFEGVRFTETHLSFSNV